MFLSCTVPKPCVPGFQPGTYEVTVAEKYDASSRFTYDADFASASLIGNSDCAGIDGVVPGTQMGFQVGPETGTVATCSYLRASLVDPRVVGISDLEISHGSNKAGSVYALFVTRDVLQLDPSCRADFFATLFLTSQADVFAEPVEGQVPPVLMGRTLASTQCGTCTEYWVVRIARVAAGGGT